MSVAGAHLGDIRGVLFDMDGLLIDSEIIYTIVVNEILKPYGKEQTWEIKSKLMGTPERTATEILLAGVWPPTDSERAEGKLFSSECPFTVDSFLSHRNMSLDDYFRKVKPMPGAQRLVSHLAKHNVPMAVATGSKRRNCGCLEEASSCAKAKRRSQADISSLYPQTKSSRAPTQIFSRPSTVASFAAMTADSSAESRIQTSFYWQRGKVSRCRGYATLALSTMASRAAQRERYWSLRMPSQAYRQHWLLA